MFVDFLDHYRAKTTRSMYVSAWVKFLSLAYGARLKGASPEILDPWVAKYVNDLRNGRRDLAADLRALGESCRAPKTCLGYQSAVRTLLTRTGISLPPTGEDRIHRARRQNPTPSSGEAPAARTILKLLEHLDTRGRAILYVLASSGARLGEVLSIRLEDLDLGSRPARFRIRDPEGGVQRVAFISREAVGAIRVYLIVRDRFIASARARGGTRDPAFLFPLGTRAFEQVWALALSKAGLEGLGGGPGGKILTPRATRRFFAERMRTVLPAPVVSEMMGGTGPLPDPNHRRTEEELGKAYLDGERAITLHRSQERERLARKVAELERIVGLLQERAGERDRELARIREILLQVGGKKPGRRGRVKEA
jgi:integrase